jgi:hypothetical protein
LEDDDALHRRDILQIDAALIAGKIYEIDKIGFSRKWGRA